MMHFILDFSNHCILIIGVLLILTCLLGNVCAAFVVCDSFMTSILSHTAWTVICLLNVLVGCFVECLVFLDQVLGIKCFHFVFVVISI